MNTKKTGATAPKALKYVQLISRSKEEVSKEELTLEVEMAANKMEQGILSMKQELLGFQSKVKSAQIAVSQAETELGDAKAYRPFDPQKIVNALSKVRSVNNKLETAKEELAFYEGLYNQMTDIKTELFGE